MKTGTKTAAPLLDGFIERASGASDAHDDDTKSLVATLIDKIKTLEVCGDDDHRQLWLWCERGAIADFGDYNEYLEYGDVESYEEFFSLWHCYYPEKIKWYKLTYLSVNQVAYIYMDGKLIFQIDPTMQHDYSADNTELATWLTNAVDEAIEMLGNDTYNRFIADNLSFHKRLGKIKRKDFWGIFPELRQNYFRDICEAEIQAFLDLTSKQPKESPENRISQMTAGFFFDCCKLGYAANSYEQASELSAKQLYINNADGRDDGLLDLDEDSAEAFADWYHNRKKIGGHPWEVCRGGNSTHISLCVRHDDKGWYLSLAGSSYGRSVETIKFYLALAKASIPIFLHESTGIASRLIENDYIGIVPDGTIPRYCSGLFPDVKILDFMNLSDTDSDKIITSTEWYPIPPVKIGRQSA